MVRGSSSALGWSSENGQADFRSRPVNDDARTSPPGPATDTFFLLERQPHVRITSTTLRFSREVFDTQCNNFRSRVFEGLKKLVHEGKVHILLTDVNHGEVKQHISKYAGEAAALIGRLTKKERALQFVRPQLPDYSTLRDTLNAEFDAFCEEAEIRVVKCDGLPVRTVLDRYLSKEPPFGKGKKKSEFPDAFALDAIKRWQEEQQRAVAVVSGDGDWRNALDGHEPITHFEKVEHFLDHVQSYESLYSYLKRFISANVESLQAGVKEGFEESGFFLYELDGDVERISVQSVDLRDPSPYMWDSEDNTGCYVERISTDVTQDREVEVIVDLSYEVGEEDSFQLEDIGLDRRDYEVSVPWPPWRSDVSRLADERRSIKESVPHPSTSTSAYSRTPPSETANTK